MSEENPFSKEEEAVLAMQEAAMSGHYPFTPPNLNIALSFWLNPRDGGASLALRNLIDDISAGDASWDPEVIEGNINQIVGAVVWYFRTLLGENVRRNPGMVQFIDTANSILKVHGFPSFEELMQDYYDFIASGHYKDLGKHDYFHEFVSVMFPLAVVAMGGNVDDMDPNIVVRRDNEGNYLPLAYSTLAVSTYMHNYVYARKHVRYPWSPNISDRKRAQLRQLWDEPFEQYKRERERERLERQREEQERLEAIRLVEEQERVEALFGPVGAENLRFVLELMRSYVERGLRAPHWLIALRNTPLEIIMEVLHDNDFGFATDVLADLPEDELRRLVRATTFVIQRRTANGEDVGDEIADFDLEFEHP